MMSNYPAKQAVKQAPMHVPSDIQEAIDNLDSKASDLRDYESEVRAARREVEFAKDEIKRQLVDNGMLEYLTVNMAMIRKGSRE